MSTKFLPTPWVPLGGGGIGTHQHMHEQVTTGIKGRLSLVVSGVDHVLEVGTRAR